MLKIESVNKYYNKGKKNQIHVIDNTTLTLNDSGLVALLGSSGCGKTTLLNVIGGLDRIKSGKIYINNQKISSRCSRKVDKIRNLEVGYIFQDYKLINDKSVFDNVAIVLKMIGIKDKEEIKKRVEFVLDKVGMLRYKRRPATMLSGGEKQRVAIARAIVKDPTIILADEPTGNLDSKNSLEVMKILQAISKERLVILVTHEQKLAKFYSNRIIEIQDGKVVNDMENKDVIELDYELDNTFYLKDFKNHNTIKDDNYDINIYSNNKEKINVELVVANGNIYIKSKGFEKIEVVDENSSIELVNEHYKKTTKEELDKYTFDYDEIKKKKYSSINNLLTFIVDGFKKILDYSFLKKMLLIGFFLSGAFIMYAVSSIYASYQIYDNNFVIVNKDYLSINIKEVKVKDYLEYENLDNIKYMLPGNSLIQVTMKFDDYLQSEYLEETASLSLASTSLINEDDIILGRMPENDKEIVLDKLSLDIYLKSDMAKMIALKKEEDIIGRKVKINQSNKEFTIVGMVNKGSPCFYTNESNFINIIYYNMLDDLNENNIYNYNDYKDDIKIKKGRKPKKDYEVIVNYDNRDSMKLNKKIKTKVNGVKLKVVGYYTSKHPLDAYLASDNTIKYLVIDKSSNITIYSNDKNSTISYFKENKMNIVDTYEESKRVYKEEIKGDRYSTLIASSIILIISLIEIFLMIRSSFLSRIKEVGILRAIGVKKKDIYKMFTGEIISITIIGGIPGIAFCSYVLGMIANNSVFQIEKFVVNSKVILIAVAIMFIFNLFIGLLPVFNTIRKTPASILARHDLD